MRVQHEIDPGLRDAWRFFHANAGWCTPPGKAKCALDLARAEHKKPSDWVFEWVFDSHFDYDGWADEEIMEYARPKFESGEWQPEGCVLSDGNGNVLASLWGIVDADAAYRRVIEAELTDEALHELSRIGQVWSD